MIILFINMSTTFEFLTEECKFLVKQLSKYYQDKAPSRRLINCSGYCIVLPICSNEDRAVSSYCSKLTLNVSLITPVTTEIY